MDSWTDNEIKAMREGGNQALNDFFDKYNVPRDTHIKRKYNTAAAELYREMYIQCRGYNSNRIKAKVEGREPPTELPREMEDLTQAEYSDSFIYLMSRKTDETGSVAARMHSEAQERLNAKFGPAGIGSQVHFRLQRINYN